MKARLLLFIAALALVAICAEPPASAPLDDKRAYMLALMNSVRLNLNTGLVSLYLDGSLNTMAQGHSVDMVTRNFFSHTNPSGQTPQDRATAFGFTYPVGENIAYGPSLDTIHANLMASPGHYNNTINKDWTRAGVGIYYNNTQIFVTILFSVRDFVQYPVSQAELSPVLAQLDTYITTKNTYVKTKIASLSTHITNWLIAGRPVGIFTYLSSVGYPLTTMSFQMYQTTWSSTIGTYFTSSNRFVASTAAPVQTKYGVGLYVASNGMTTAAVVFST